MEEAASQGLAGVQIKNAKFQRQYGREALTSEHIERFGFYRLQVGTPPSTRPRRAKTRTSVLTLLL